MLPDATASLAKRARIVVGAATRHRAGSGSGLTERETEVLQLLAEGRTNLQIAQHLFLSPKTVGIHVQRMLEKPDAHTRGKRWSPPGGAVSRPEAVA